MKKWVQWVEMIVRGDLWQKEESKKDGYKKKNWMKMFIGSDRDGPASKSEEQLRLSGLELKRGKAVMAQTCAEEG